MRAIVAAGWLPDPAASAILSARHQGPGGWHIEAEPELNLGVDPDSCPVVPDLAGWRVTTLPVLDEEHFTVVPDRVCETLSPRRAVTDRTLDMPFYARCGVGHAWLVDPILRTLDVYRLESGRWTLLGTRSDEAEVRAESFDAIVLALGAWWSARAPCARDERGRGFPAQATSSQSRTCGSGRSSSSSRSPDAATASSTPRGATPRRAAR